MGLKMLRKILSPTMYGRLARGSKTVLSWCYRDDLTGLARIFHTDKWGSHWYTPHYDHYFRPLKSERLNILEIGVGGYERLNEGGASLRMWKSYFRKSQIVGIDIYDKSHLSEHRIDVRQCDQTDAESLINLSTEYRGFDIIIDDGSHLNEHTVKTFQVLFPLLRPNGIYVVEDTQTSYWPTWGGGINSTKSSMAFFKTLVDGLNYVEYPVENYRPTYFDKNIVEISFFHNLVFIRKGSNHEATNMPELIERELATLRAVRPTT